MDHFSLTDDELETFRSLLVVLRDNRVTRFSGLGVSVEFGAESVHGFRQEAGDIQEREEDVWASSGLMPKPIHEIRRVE